MCSVINCSWKVVKLIHRKCNSNLSPWTIIDYHMDSIEILPYIAVNFLLCCHGQVPLIQSKDLRLTKLLLICQRYLPAGQAYVALSCVTSLEGLQILNYNSTAIKKDKRVNTEMLRLKPKPITFVWPMIPTLPQQDFIKICHLNVRGYFDHVNDLKTDHVISSMDVISLTETHLCNSDTVHPNSQPIKSHLQYREDRVGGVQKGGIMMFYKLTNPVYTSKHRDFRIRISCKLYLT